MNPNFETQATNWLKQGADFPRGLRVGLIRLESETEQGSGVCLEGLGFRILFVAQYIAETTPRRVQAKLPRHHLRQRKGPYPLVVLPHLSQRTASLLWDEHISAIDLCGNYQLVVPGKIVLQRLERPNRFPASSTIQDIWGGTSSLVPRALLLEQWFSTQTALLKHIQSLGGAISKGTVSKVLKVLEEMLWIERKPEIVLSHPREILRTFAEGYRPPPTLGRQTIQLNSPEQLLVPTDNAPRYAWFEPEAFVLRAQAGQLPRVYTDNLSAFLTLPGIQTTRRFADAEVIETHSPGVFFALAQGRRGPIVSKLEVYLCLATGSKRDQDAASQLHNEIVQGQT